MKSLSLLFLVIMMSACTMKNKYQNAVNEIPVDTIIDIPDTLFINHNVVVFWWPDSIQQIEMKKNYDEISYNTFVNDLTWYTERSIEMLDSIHVKNKITDRDVIVFKRKKKGDLILKRKETKGNMVLFNVKKDPFITNMNSYNRNEVISYFR